jgi:CheY-like chemotaxis protein
MASPAFNLEISDTSLSRRADGLRRRVLYAEDQASARIVTTALLERMGFEVVAVEDGELALEQAKSSTYDLILLDIEMPVMDGVTAARHIREEAELCQDAPILALSAFLADSTEHCQWRGAFDSALPKPANSNELRKAVRHALERKRAEPLVGAPETLLWGRFSHELPRGTISMLVKAAHTEMHHLVNGIAACLAAGDMVGATTCRKALKSLANSFGASEIAALLVEGAERADETPMLLFASNDWRIRQARL